MAMASTGTKIVPESASKVVGGLNISILPLDCEERVHGAWSLATKAGHPQSLSDALSLKTVRAPKDLSMYSLDVNSDSCSSPTSSYKGKLPMVLEESESFSHTEGSSIWDTSASSSLSSMKSSSSAASSTRPFFRRGAPVDKGLKRKKQQKLQRTCNKETSLVCLLLWPLRKVRDGYMRCIMGLDGAGDLSGLAQGATFATSTQYFVDLPVSKTDARNHG